MEIGERTIGAFIVVTFFDTNQIILVQHNYGEKKWSLPGGGLEAGETPDVAAQRELLEETGLYIPLEYLGEFFLHKNPGVIYVFRGEVCSLTKILGSNDLEEIRKVAFFSADNLPKDIYPAQRKIIERFFLGRIRNHSLKFELL